MGIQSDIQADLAEAFDTDLADAVNNFSIIQYSRGQSNYDPNTGDAVQTPTTNTSRGVFGSYQQTEILNSDIEPTDVKLIVLQNELDTTPYIGNQIVNSVTTQRFRVIDVIQDPANATWELQIRSTK